MNATATEQVQAAAEKIRPPRFDVRVTQAEIETAIPANSGHCMVADAVKRSFVAKYKRSPKAVSVDLQTVRFTDPKTRMRYIYLTPTVAQRALLQFDQAIKPTPFSFRLKASGSQAIPAMRHSVRREKQNRSEAQNTQTKTAKKIQTEQARRKRAVIVTRHHDDGNPNVHIKVGGKAPPRAVLTGNRRQFGVKTAGVLDGPTQ